MRFCFCLLLSLGIGGCDSSRDAKPPAREEGPLELLDPPEEKDKGRGKCSLEPRFRPVRLRARGTENLPRASIEVGGAEPRAGGYYVTALRTTSASRALLLVVDEQGRSREIPLSLVHGSVEPPELAVDGTRAFVVLSDNEATHHRLRVVRVDPSGAETQLSWGPEVSMTRDESMAYAVALTRVADASRGVLVWDDFRKSSARSTIMALSFSSSSLKAEAPAVSVSPPDHDAVAPRVFAHGQGFYLTWLRYAPLDPSNPDQGLVQDPPARLFAARLNALGRPVGEPIALSSEHRSVLTYDAAVTHDGLLVAMRDAVSGRALGADHVSLLRLGEDGSVVRGEASHEVLGPGLPVLLTDGEAVPWLVARGLDEQLLIGEVHGVQVDWGPEAELSTRIALTRRGDHLVVLTPDGLDLVLSEYRCSFDQ